MKTLPAVDVVIIGGGWTGLLMAKELGTRTPLSIVVLERGKVRKTEDYGDDMDELDYAIRLRMMQDASFETVTFRHNVNERALPLRQHGAFFAGTGTGGAGEHWNGVALRFLPDCFELLSRTTEKYGARRLPEDHSIQDWGLRYDELEPYYARSERMMGVSGKAGNLRGEKIAGGNVLEGWRSAEYPLPPTKMPYFSTLFRDASQTLGYHPCPIPAAAISQTYTNPDGVARAGCTYCGYCERFGCMVGAKSQPTNTLLPVIQKHKNISIRNGAWVRRIVIENENKNGAHGAKARGVSYIDAQGAEVFQPAELVFLASWTLNNNRLLLLSGIGQPYNPNTGEGTLGRNLTHQVFVPAATAFFEKPLNRFMGSGSSGIMISDWDGDLFDHTGLPFLRGGYLLSLSTGNRPVTNFGTLPPSVKAKWGSDWKRAALRYFDRTGSIQFNGEHLAYKGNYMDLDPLYKDSLGDPLLRMTIDWRDNERKMSDFIIGKAVEIAHAMGATEVSSFPGLRKYDATRYQSTHLQGGVIMGTSPDRSVLNPFLQHWQASNLFVLGASAFPQNASANPTLTSVALTWRTADAVVDRYLKNPAPLA